MAEISRVYYVGESGIEVKIFEDGSRDHPRLSASERKELNIKIKADKMLSKMSSSKQEFSELQGILYKLNLDYVSVWSEIIEKKMKPEEAKSYLLELERYHVLLWRG